MRRLTTYCNSACRVLSAKLRGGNLLAAGVLKTEIIGSIPDAQRAGYENKWADAEEDLGSFYDLLGQVVSV